MRGADEVSRHKAVQAAHVLAAALAAIAIAIVSQGWPSSDGACEGAGVCTAADLGLARDPASLLAVDEAALAAPPVGTLDDHRAL